MHSVSLQKYKQPLFPSDTPTPPSSSPTASSPTASSSPLFLLCLSSQRLCVTAPGAALSCWLFVSVRCSDAKPNRKDDGFLLLCAPPNLLGCFSGLAGASLLVCVCRPDSKKEIGSATRAGNGCSSGHQRPLMWCQRLLLLMQLLLLQR